LRPYWLAFLPDCVFLRKVKENMSEKTEAMDQPVKFSRKCPECGLRNFVDATECRRCEADLSPRSIKVKDSKAKDSKDSKDAKDKEIEQIPDQPLEPGRSKVPGISILAAALVILFALVLFYVRRVSQEAEAVPDQAEVAQSTTQSEEPYANPAAEDDPQSQTPAKQILAVLTRFQATPKSDMSYEEYDQMLTDLKADLNKELPTFVRHTPNDESFRKEVLAALRDYTAAGNWWKTTMRNSKVLTDADRLVRVQSEWSSAQTHLDNAEKLLQP
jgi:ribosomal protein L40E